MVTKNVFAKITRHIMEEYGILLTLIFKGEETMRKPHYVTINTIDGGEYFYDIYIRGSMAAIKEAKRQLFDRYNYEEKDICKIDCCPQ